MNSIRIFALAGTMFAFTGAAMLMPVPAGAFQTSELRLQTRLAGGALNGVTPSGSARFRARSGHSNLSVEVEDASVADGTILTVTIQNSNGSTPAGTMRVTRRTAEIDVNTKDGDIVPQAKAGDTIIVSGPSGAILSGALR